MSIPNGDKRGGQEFDSHSFFYNCSGTKTKHGVSATPQQAMSPKFVNGENNILLTLSFLLPYYMYAEYTVKLKKSITTSNKLFQFNYCVTKT